ncbi:MAG: DUF2244 domain-containing protein [Caulobacteraceae bacterium]
MDARLHLDAVLTPTRSLSRAGLYVLLGILALFNTLVAILFFAMGAKPIPIFLGFDFLAVLLAFHLSYRQARRRERVQVSADEVRVVHEVGAQKRTVWRSPTAFTRVEVEARDQPEVRVTLALSRRRLVVAGQVSPQERTDFASALEAAIRSARAERQPT